MAIYCAIFLASTAVSAQSLRVVGGTDYAPLTYSENGVLKGYEIDVIKALSVAMNSPLDLSLMPWQDAQREVQDGSADILTPMTITEERKKLWDFAEPTTQRTYNLFIRSFASGIDSLDDLRGKRVGVLAGSFPVEAVSAYKDITCVVTASSVEGFEKLKNGEIDAFASDLWVGSYVLEKTHLGGIRVLPRPLATLDAGIAVKKGNTALLDRINKAVKQLYQDGTIGKLRAKWEPDEVVFMTHENLRSQRFLTAGLVVGALVVFLLLWILNLNYQIIKRKKVETELRQEKQFIETIMNMSPDILYIYDLSLRKVVYSNARISRVLGYSSDEIADMGGEVIAALINPDDFKEYLEKVGKHYQEFKDGELIRYSYRMRTKLGDWRWMECQEVIYRRSADGKAIQIFGEAQDITARKKTDEELSEHRNHLEYLVGKRTQELSDSLLLLKRTQEQIIASEKFAMLGQLVAGVAHEINTPIGVAVTASSFAEVQLKTLLNDFVAGEAVHSRLQKVAEAEQLTLSNLSRASEIISSFKRLAVDQASDMQRVFNLKEVIDGTIQSLSPSLKPTPYRVEVECPPTIKMKSFPGVISQIVTNLVFNSISHGFDKRAWGTMWLRCTMEGNDVVLNYSDNGKGIPEALHDKIFTPFFTTKHGTGTGLGLSIIHNLVTQKLKGTVHFRNTEQGGAEFVVTMPQG